MSQASPAAPFTRSYPRRFTFYVADPTSSILRGALSLRRAGLMRLANTAVDLIHHKRVMIAPAHEQSVVFDLEK